MKFRNIIIILSALSLSACAGGGEFPSLAKRSFETVAEEQPLPAPPPLLPSNASLLTRIDALVAKARGGEAAYRAALAIAQSAVASGGRSATGSDSWINAQMLVTRLERTLEPAQSALSTLDGERRALALGGASADGPAMAAAWNEVDGIASNQTQSVAKLLAAFRR